MGHYHHLTAEEREDIMVQLRLGASITKIAKGLGRSPSTVSRELSRNSTPRYYRASTAQRRYEERRARCRRPRLMDDPERLSLVSRWVLEGRWSPQQLEGRIAIERPELAVSDTTIYREVWSGGLDRLIGGRKASARLRMKGRRRKKGGEAELRGKIKVSHEIGERPAEAGSRSRPGDWEGDTVVGRTGGARLLTLVDRMSRYLAGGKTKGGKSAHVTPAMAWSLRGRPLASLTLDRGKEFAGHAALTEELGVEVYFCLPHHPWQRGTNENTNGLLREYFPKGKPLDDVSDEEVQRVYDELNRRPRRCLGFRTPWEVYHSQTLHLL